MWLFGSRPVGQKTSSVVHTLRESNQHLGLKQLSPLEGSSYMPLPGFRHQINANEDMYERSHRDIASGLNSGESASRLWTAFCDCCLLFEVFDFYLRSSWRTPEPLQNLVMRGPGSQFTRCWFTLLLLLNPNSCWSNLFLPWTHIKRTSTRTSLLQYIVEKDFIVNLKVQSEASGRVQKRKRKK